MRAIIEIRRPAERHLVHAKWPTLARELAAAQRPHRRARAYVAFRRTGSIDRARRDGPTLADARAATAQRELLHAQCGGRGVLASL